MIPRHVTSLAAIFVCNLLFSCVQSAPNAALLKLIASKQSQDLVNKGSIPPSSISSFINDYISSISADPSAEDGGQFWQDPARTNPMLMPSGNSLTSAGSPMMEEEAEEAKNSLPEASKRFHPSAFFGSRGKRFYGGLTDAYKKRFFQQAFVGSRGKRLQPSLLSRERVGDEEAEGKRMTKRFDPSGFTGSRGKRYIPGLEALFLSQMYRKLDAEKWKRQSLLGFHAARG